MTTSQKPRMLHVSRITYITAAAMIELNMTRRLQFLCSISLALLVTNVQGFAANGKIKATTLPKLDPATSKYVPPSNLSSSQFYSPVSTLIRAGPVPFVTRLVQPSKYEQAVWKYMVDAEESSLQTAQGNMDAFFASPELWAEQKLLEQQGRREVYDYGRDIEPERIVLASVWGLIVLALGSRAFWQLLNGNRNLF